ncbi:MAG: patatin-like phospholipase family protein [Candidatus Marinimicrobia bacterium]|nr:patatin-like phospholipase family protein [Candidatus Neomarinimicrobiota bacterium]
MFIFSSLIGAERPKIGLTLSGGGALGFAHIPLLKALDSLEIPIDYITGTSMGGLVGALYAIGYSGKEIEAMSLTTDWQKVFTDKPPRETLPYFQKKDADRYQYEVGIEGFVPIDKGGVIAGQNIMMLFSNLTSQYAHNTDFDKLPIPFRCVAVNLVDGKEVILKRGSLAKAMRATMSVPTIFSPVEWGDSLLVDGGLLNNLPVDVIKEMGAEVVIASAVGFQFREREKIKGTLEVLIQSYNVMRDSKMAGNAVLADILIDVRLHGATPVDFTNAKLEKIVAQGFDAMTEALPHLVELKAKYNLSRNIHVNSQAIPILLPKVQEIDVIGNIAIPDEAIRALMNIPIGENYRPDSLSEAIARLKATGDFNHIDVSVKPMIDQSVRLIVTVEEKNRPIINELKIVGNQTLPNDFIIRLLGIKPGAIFILSNIEDRITYLYSLGYFETVYYEVKTLSKNSIRLILNVKELPMTKLRVGARYDSRHGLVGALNLQMTNILIPGLRIDNEVQFIGLNRVSSRAFYPSRTLDFPLYPFIRFDYKRIPTYVYNTDGDRIASYLDRSTTIGLGAGILYKNYWNIETRFDREFVNIHPDITSDETINFVNWKDRLWEFHANSDIDRLDNAFAPHKGMLLHIGYEESFQTLKARSRYSRLEIYGDWYHTLWDKHIIRLYGFFGESTIEGIANKFLYQNGPDRFIGADYDEIVGTRLSVVRFDYAYEFRKNAFLKVIVNTLYGFQNEYMYPGIHPEPMTGFGIAFKYVTPAGPIQLALGQGNKSIYKSAAKQGILYLTAGYNF